MSGPKKKSDLKKVLLIDDDDVMLDLLETMVHEQGYLCHKSFSFEDGINAVKHNNFVFVITDIFMEGIGGIEGIRQLKNLDPFIPVMAISGGFSGMSGEKTVEAARTVGADAGLPKPFDKDTFDEAFAVLKAAAIS